MFSETLTSLLSFIDTNSASMNDVDFSDMIQIISNKFENDNLKRINLNTVENSSGFQILKKHINSNFDKLLHDNFSNQNLLSLIGQLNSRGRPNLVFSLEQSAAILESNLNNILNNHTKMSTSGLLNSISLLSSQKFIPGVGDIIRSRAEDAQSLSFNMQNRLLKRVASERISNNVREAFVRLLGTEFLNLAAGEKMINKCRAFNAMAKVESMNPFSNMHRSRMAALFKDIRSQAENHDQQSIILMVEALNFYEDPTKNEALREFCEIVSMTIKHLAENVRLDFVLRFVEQISQMRSDIINEEQLRTIFDYIVAQLQTNDTTKRLPSFNAFLPTFALMRRTKFFDKEVVEKILAYVEPNLHKVSQKDEIRDLKSVVYKVMGEQYLQKMESNVINSMESEIDRYTGNLNQYVSSIGKAAKLGNINNETTKIFVDTLSKKFFAKLQAEKPANPWVVFMRYLEIQEYLNNDLRTQFVDQLLSIITEADFINSKNIQAIVNSLYLLQFKGENETLRAKLKEKIEIATSDPRFKKGFVNSIARLKENQNVSNFLLFKMSAHLREFSKDPEFLTENPRFFEKILTSCFYLLYKLERDSTYNTEGVSALMNITDFIFLKASNPQVDIVRYKLPFILKTFDKSHINTPILKKSMISYFDNSKDLERSFLSNDSILLLEKLLRSDIADEELDKVLSKVFPNPSNLETYLNSTTSLFPKVNIIKFYANLNKKRPELATDEFVTKIKNYLLNDIIRGNADETIKLNALNALVYFKNQILNYQNDKEFNGIIRSIFNSLPIRKLFKTIDSLPPNPKSRITKRLMLEFSMVYERDTTVDKFLLLKIVDKFTQLNWMNPGFYNKAIQDFEKTFDAFSVHEHANLIYYFARVEFNKEDVIRASLKNINTKIINDTGRFDLFNSLVQLGLTDQEWKDTCLENLLKDTDINMAYVRANFKEKANFINNLWKLGDWPSNNKEMVYFK